MKSPATDYVLGIDIGTGSCKGLAINLHGKKLADSNSFYGIQNNQPGFAEQDPEVIWTAFEDCIKIIFSKLKQAPIAVSFSSAMHGVMIIGKENKPLTPLLIWADKRSESIAKALRKKEIAKEIYTETGTPIYSMSPLCKIMWFRKNDPKIFKQAARFVSIKEFIWFRLFNEWQIDSSIASATGLLNIHTLTWNKPSLDLCGITPSQLSEIVPTVFTRSDVNPDTAHVLGIKTKIAFCIGANDGCLANLGSFVLKKGEAALTIGTSGAIRVTGQYPLSDFKSMLFNYVLDESTYISGGPINNGGIVIKWLLKTFLNVENIENPDVKDYENLFNNINSVPPGSDGLIFLPYLLGERAPVWDAKASALFFGIHYRHTQNHFLRAAVEGICFAIKDILEPIEKKYGTINQLNISGGFINSPVWMQMMSDITGKKLCLIEKDDASSLGAAMLAMKQLKLIKSYEQLKPETKLTISPDKKNAKIYDANFAIYKQLYNCLGKLMHRD